MSKNSAWLRGTSGVGCALAVAAVLAGCSSSSKPQPESASSNPPGAASGASLEQGAACDLVTQAEVEELIGTALEAGVPYADEDDAQCTFAGLAGGPFAQVEVYLGPAAKKMLDADMSMGNTFEPVSGIGDEAQSGQHSIYIRKGETWVDVHASHSGESNDFTEQLVTLARKVAPRV